MAQTTIMVPEGHTVQVHPPGHTPMPSLPPMSSGMIADPAMQGAKAAMDAALPVPNEQKAAPAAPTQPARKKKPAGDAKTFKGDKTEGNEGSKSKEKTPR